MTNLDLIVMFKIHSWYQFDKTQARLGGGEEPSKETTQARLGGGEEPSKATTQARLGAVKSRLKRRPKHGLGAVKSRLKRQSKHSLGAVKSRLKRQSKHGLRAVKSCLKRQPKHGLRAVKSRLNNKLRAWLRSGEKPFKITTQTRLGEDEEALMTPARPWLLFSAFTPQILMLKARELCTVLVVQGPTRFTKVYEPRNLGLIDILLRYFLYMRYFGSVGYDICNCFSYK